MSQQKDVDEFLKIHSVDKFNKYVDAYVADKELQDALKQVSNDLLENEKSKEAFLKFMETKNAQLNKMLLEV